MMRIFSGFCCVVLLVMIEGCGGSVPEVITPDELTLYSIDGRDFDPPESKPKTDETFHGYPVLGKVEITDPYKRKELMAAVVDGIARGGPASKCFWPRHGLRVVQNGQVLEYVICYHCFNYELYSGNNMKRGGTTSEEPKEVLNKELSDRDIPLAPER